MIFVTDPALLCTSENHIRSSWFADTYRTEITDGGLTRKIDIQHISLPFDRTKETAFKSRYGMDDDKMHSFYSRFAADIRNSWKVSEVIRAMDHPDMESCLLPALSVSVRKKPTGVGSDIYTVFDVSDTLESAGILSFEGAELHSVLRFFLRLTDAAERFSKYGICIGYPDPDMLAAAGENGGRILFRNLINFSCGEYASCPYEGITFPFEAFPGDIRDMNLKYVCALIWTLLDGRSPGYFPDFTVPPSKAPVSVAKAMVGIMSDGARSLHGLRSAVNTVLESRDDCYVSLVSATGVISYDPEFHPGDTLIRARAIREEAEDDEYYGRMKKGAKRTRYAILAALLAGTVLTVSLFPGRSLSAQSSAPASRQYMSCKDDIYAFEGKAVDIEGRALPGLVLDDEGAVRSSPENELLFDRDHVSVYTAVRGIRCEILLKDSVPGNTGVSYTSYTLEVWAEPTDCLEKHLLLLTGMSVSVNGGANGNEHRIGLDSDGRSVFTVCSASPGKCSVCMKSPVSDCSASLELEFTQPVRETPESIPSTAPNPEEPAPFIQTPAPSPAVVQAFLPGMAPVPSFSEGREFTLSVPAMNLWPGESESVVTSGEDGGIIYVYSTDESVASVQISGNADGCYTITGIQRGSCEIVFSSMGVKHTVEVTVR